MSLTCHFWIDLFASGSIKGDVDFQCMQGAIGDKTINKDQDSASPSEAYELV
jgi:hypothetical protein